MSTLEEKKNLIKNGISAGMDMEDMFILSHCTMDQMATLRADSFFLSECACEAKILEKDLLHGLIQTIALQQDKGKDHGTIWLLGKLNPRFSDRPESGDKPGVINIHTQNLNLETMDTVAVHNLPREELVLTPDEKY